MLPAVSAVIPARREERAGNRVMVVGPGWHMQRPDGPARLLCLGVVRPFKGVEDMVEAFSGLSRADAERFRLTIVGETWKGWTAPDEAIARSPHADLIERVDRYVSDAELSGAVPAPAEAAA